MTVKLNDILQGFIDIREEARYLFITINKENKLPEAYLDELSNIIEDIMDCITLLLLEYKLIYRKETMNGKSAKKKQRLGQDKAKRK